MYIDAFNIKTIGPITIITAILLFWHAILHSVICFPFWFFAFVNFPFDSSFRFFLSSFRHVFYFFIIESNLHTNSAYIIVRNGFWKVLCFNFNVHYPFCIHQLEIGFNWNIIAIEMEWIMKNTNLPYKRSFIRFWRIITYLLIVCRNLHWVFAFDWIREQLLNKYYSNLCAQNKYIFRSLCLCSAHPPINLQCKFMMTNTNWISWQLFPIFRSKHLFEINPHFFLFHNLALQTNFN